MPYVLDTDIVSALQNKHPRVVARIALLHGYTLVTRNTKDFEAVPGLAPLENWVDA